MQCDNVDQHLSAYRDGELEPNLAREVREHLAGCASCRAALYEMDQVWDLLGAHESIEPPADFLAVVRRRVSTHVRPVMTYARAKVWAMGAAAAVVLCAFGLFAALTPSPDGPIGEGLPDDALFAPLPDATVERDLMKAATEDPDMLGILETLEIVEGSKVDLDLLRDLDAIASAQRSLEGRGGDEITLVKAAALLDLESAVWSD
jgi:hypothetical protein